MLTQSPERVNQENDQYRDAKLDQRGTTKNSKYQSPPR